MVRLWWLLVLGATICNAADLPLVIGAKGQPMPPLSPPPKLGEKFKKEPTDHLIVGDSESWMANLAAYRRDVKRAEEVPPNTKIELVSLAGTPFENAQH